MQRLFVIILLSSTWALAGCQPVTQPTTTATSSSSLAVSGSAAVEAVPDRLQLSLSVERTGQDIPKLKAEVDGITATLIDYLRKQEIRDDHIQSFAVRIHPQYRYDEGQQQLMGYQVTRRMTIHFLEPEQHSPFLEYALQNGVQRVEEPHYTLSNADALYQQALTEALQLARQKADKLAAAAGVSIIGVETIRETSNQGPVVRYRVAQAEMSADVSLPGQQSVEARVDVVYQLSDQN